MRFAVNRYNVSFHVVLEDPAPLPDARLEHHPFGRPPFEMRSIWMVEISDLQELLDLTQKVGVNLELSHSAYWSGASLEIPGERLYGISVIDDPHYEIDPRDRPKRIVKEP